MVKYYITDIGTYIGKDIGSVLVNRKLTQNEMVM